jgi:large subunit ribosomal protein L29
MEVKELREKNLSELFKILKEEREKLFKLKIEKSLKKLTKPHLLRETKKNIARILTIINEKRKENEKKS